MLEVGQFGVVQFGGKWLIIKACPKKSAKSGAEMVQFWFPEFNREWTRINANGLSE